jgi:hypothetical protein
MLGSFVDDLFGSDGSLNYAAFARAHAKGEFG